MATSEPPRPPSGILPSNVDNPTAAETPARKKSAPPLGWLLVAVLTFVAGVAITLVLTAPRPNSQPSSASSAAPPPPQAQARTTPGVPVVSGQAQGRTGPGVPAPSPDINGISCDALESTIFHIHVHLAVFFDGEEQQIPFGIGIAQPWQVSDSDEGPFVDDGACFYWIHTHTEDGIIHIEAPVRRPFTLGDFFAIWQQPLSATQVGPKQGQVIVYVNGQRDQTNPPDIRLLPHQRIQLDVGTDVPPYQFDFPPGD
jgi:hypothetical protein